MSELTGTLSGTNEQNCDGKLREFPFLSTLKIQVLGIDIQEIHKNQLHRYLSRLYHPQGL